MILIGDECISRKTRREIWLSVESQISEEVKDIALMNVWIPNTDQLWHRTINHYMGVLDEERQRWII